MVKKRRQKRKKDTWECPLCGADNNEEDEICQGCGSLRKEPCYDAISDEIDRDA